MQFFSAITLLFATVAVAAPTTVDGNDVEARSGCYLIAGLCANEGKECLCGPAVAGVPTCRCV